MLNTGRIFTIHCLSSDWLISPACLCLFTFLCFWFICIALHLKIISSFLVLLSFMFVLISVSLFWKQNLWPCTCYSCQVIKSLILDILLCAMNLALNLSWMILNLFNFCCCCSHACENVKEKISAEIDYFKKNGSFLRSWRESKKIYEQSELVEHNISFFSF